MAAGSSRAEVSRAAGSSSYDHRYHVGNHADVWKHAGWLALLAALKRERLTVVDTHAGRGGYDLPRTGEWTEGVGRLLDAFPEGSSTGSGAVDRYLARIRRHGQGRYPGSPALTVDALGRSDRLLAFERDPDAAAELRGHLRDPRATVRAEDGWGAARELPADAVVLIDPPYVEPADWTAASDAVVAARGARVMLWYPIKRWTRPNALLARIDAAGVPFVALDLVVAPFTRSLAGSGLLLVNGPASVVAEIAAAGTVLGPVLSGGSGWTLRVTGGPRARPPSG